MSASEPLGHLLSRICQLTHARMHMLAGQTGLHRGQTLALKVLSAQDGQTHAELAGRLCVRPPTVTNMIHRLEKAGLVERRPDPSDQRLSRVYLTESGIGVQAQVKKVWADFETLVFAGLDESEKNQLKRIFEKIEYNLGIKEE